MPSTLPISASSARRCVWMSQSLATLAACNTSRLCSSSIASLFLCTSQSSLTRDNVSDETEVPRPGPANQEITSECEEGSITSTSCGCKSTRNAWSEAAVALSWFDSDKWRSIPCFSNG